MLEANRRLVHRGLTKKQLAKAILVRGHAVSEMMVLRCLHDDERRRIPTIEAIDAISDALGIPRPVLVAASIEQARELAATAEFSAADAEMLAIAAQTTDIGDDGESQARTSPLGEGRPRASRRRSKTVRRST